MLDDKKGANSPTDLFAKPDLGIREAEGMLAKLLRKILCDIMGDDKLFQCTQRLARYNTLLTRWISNPRNGIQDDRVKQATLRGNINKQLTAAKMSVKVFLVFLQIFRCKEFEITIKPTWEDGRQTEHTLTFTNLLLPDGQDHDMNDEIKRDLQELRDGEHTEPSPIDSDDRS